MLFSNNRHQKQELLLEHGAWLDWDEFYHILVRKRSCKREQQLQLQNSPIYPPSLTRKTTQENHSTENLRDSLHSLLQGFSHILWGIVPCIFT